MLGSIANNHLLRSISCWYFNRKNDNYSCRKCWRMSGGSILLQHRFLVLGNRCFTVSLHLHYWPVPAADCSCTEQIVSAPTCNHSHIHFCVGVYPCLVLEAFIVHPRCQFINEKNVKRLVRCTGLEICRPLWQQRKTKWYEGCIHALHLQEYTNNSKQKKL